MHTGLILIDIQNDYFPGGAMELEGAGEAGRAAARLLSFFRQRRFPVVHVRHESVHPGATFFLSGTPGAEIHPCAAPVEEEPVITKHFPNAFRETALLPRLRDARVGRLAMAGMMTHMCLDAGVRAAADLGFECLVAADACATKSLAWGGVAAPAASVQAAFLAALDGTYARVISSDALVAELSRI
jgi:nicotinamidase-related amidase